MVAGELYEAWDSDLVRRRARARDLTTRYNATRQDDQEGRQALLRELLGHCGEKVWIESPFYCDDGENVELGDGTYLNFGCVVLDCAPHQARPQRLRGRVCPVLRRLPPARRPRAFRGPSWPPRSPSKKTYGSAAPRRPVTLRRVFASNPRTSARNSSAARRVATNAARRSLGSPKCLLQRCPIDRRP